MLTQVTFEHSECKIERELIHVVYNLRFICNVLLCELKLGEPPNWLNPIIRTPSNAHWSIWWWFTSFCECSLSHKICTWSVADTWNKLLTLVDYTWNCYLHLIELLLLIHINQNMFKHCWLCIDLYKSNICLDIGQSCEKLLYKLYWCNEWLVDGNKMRSGIFRKSRLLTWLNFNPSMEKQSHT